MKNARVKLARFLLLFGLGVTAAAAVGIWTGYSWWIVQLNQPFQGFLSQDQMLEIDTGTTVSEIAQRLENLGVIKSALLFRLHHRLSGQEPLKAGEYQFSGPSTMSEVLGKLRHGEVHFRRITIPEGLDLTQTAVHLVSLGQGSLDGFIKAMHNFHLVADLDPAARDLEGYLLPETYLLSGKATESELVELMVQNFRRLWATEFQERAEQSGFTTREAVTLASLIEKETGSQSERPLVSAVFHNRLRLGMKLMCDPTVIYGVKLKKGFDGIIHQSDLQFDSPYNTYLYPGLPPGPITNPGQASLEATLNPAETDYLYFVSRNDGTHAFSADYAEHRKAVDRYQR